MVLNLKFFIHHNKIKFRANKNNSTKKSNIHPQRKRTEDF